MAKPLRDLAVVPRVGDLMCLLVGQKISFQEHLLQNISWVSLMQVRLAYLGMEYSSLKEKSVAADPVDRQP